MYKKERTNTVTKQIVFGELPKAAAIDHTYKLDDAEPKRILIIGTDSYIGKSVFCFMLRRPDTTSVEITDIRSYLKKPFDFSRYDAVLYTAGPGGVLKAADKAKKVGTGMFIYISSLHVYGRMKGIITIKTPVIPSDEMGRKILSAEIELWKRNQPEFCVAILRLPEVYGYECPGSYRILSKLVCRLPFFPLYGRKCSWIHADNVSSVIKNVIYYKRPGVYFPQNISYESACEMALEIAEFYGKNLRLTRLLNPLIHISCVKLQTLQDIFTGYLCDQSLNVPLEWLEVNNMKESIRQSESGW